MANKKLVNFLKKLLVFVIPSKRLRNQFKSYIKRKLELYRLKKTYRYLTQHYCQELVPSENITHQEITIHQLPIWQLWLQGETSAPPIVKICLASIKKHIKGREVILLTENNWKNYIELPEFIMDKFKQGIITYTHFSDILRICLLEKYGGTWIDATVLLTDSTPPNIATADFFAFSVPNDSFYANFHLTSSWYMQAIPNHVIIKNLKNALFNYWQQENTLIDYFLLHLLLKGLVDNHPLLDNMWKNTPQLSNKAPHVLQFKLLDTYNQAILNEIKHNTTIHKLTYKISPNKDHNTYLNVLLEKGEY